MNYLKLSFLFAILFFGCKAQKITSGLLIKNVTIVDVEKGVLQTNKHVLIQDHKITAIYERDIPAGDSTRIIDGSGKYLIPGLWDMHTHYNWNYTYSSPLLVANGVTGVREMWGVMETIKKIREETASGALIAPDIYTAGAIIDGTPPIWQGSAGVANAGEAVKEVERQIKEEVDFLKVYSLLTREAYMAIAEKSKEHRIPFAGHVPNSISIWEAIEANQQSVEHLYGLLEACSLEPEELSKFSGAKAFGPEKANFLVVTFSRKLFDSLAVALSRSNTWISPTLTVLKSTSNLDDTTLVKDPRLDYMPAFIRKMWNPGNDFRFKDSGKERYEASRRKFALQLLLMGKLAEAGVNIIAGTDYPNPYCYPGFSLHDELQLMVEGGMTPAAALKTATYNPAVFMGKENEFGKVAKGHLASLVLLNANPLEHINNTREIDAVFLRGTYMDRSALNALLKKAKKIASDLGN